MTDFSPTPEQLSIVEAATTTTDNLLISALAGAAKTSTLVLIAEALPDTRILCLAFNKKIALEMTDRLPSNCTAMTLNSLGHRVWGDVLQRRITIESNKIGDLLKAELETLSSDEKSAAWEAFTDLVKAIGFGKQCGYIPNNYGRNAKPLLSDEEFFAHYDERLEQWEVDLIRTVSWKSLDLAWKGILDYDDQILMPTLFPAPFPRYPLILVDEAQDLSALNHATLKKLVIRRLIAVGDPYQAIYGFRGAHEESMALLSDNFKMTELSLTTSFRCPIKVVEHARFRAPRMQYPTWAIEGLVSRLDIWSPSDLPESAAVICRNNAPLFSLAIKLLQNGRYGELLGNDIGKGLLKVMKKFGDGKLPKAALLEAISSWETLKLAKAKTPGPIRDRAECMRIFANQGKNLGDALAYAEHIFQSSGPIKLMTGHKSKGLEFAHVYILDRDLLGDEGQERNLRYVMITRAKETLTYIDSRGLDTPEPDMAR